MNKNNIWVIFFISGLFIFLIYSFLYLDGYKGERKYYSYKNIIRYLDDRVTTLPYGIDENNYSDFNALKRDLIILEDKINQSLTYLEEAYKGNYYSYEQYVKLKADYEFSKKQLQKTMEVFSSKIK